MDLYTSLGILYSNYGSILAQKKAIWYSYSC